MNSLSTMSIKEMGSVNAIALCCARQLLLPVVEELFPHHDELKFQVGYGDLPESLPPFERFERLLQEEKEHLRVLQAMTTEEVEEDRRKRQAQHEEDIRAVNARFARKRDACRATLQEAKNWRLPSRQHRELKRLMISELTEKIDRYQREADYEWRPWTDPYPPHRDRIRGAKRTIRDYQAQMIKMAGEIERWNVWLRELHEAWGTPDPQQQDRPGERCAETT